VKPLVPKFLCLLLALLAGGCNDRHPAPVPALRLLCAAGLKPALDEILPAFQQATGVAVEPDYAGSGIILTRARQEGVADLFLPGDAFYVDELQRLTGRVVDRVELASLRPCIIVARGNPRRITSLQDFARPDVVVAVGNPEACQVGRVTAQLLAKAGVDALALRAKESLTVNELGLWVKVHDVDAAVVWEATAAALGPAVEGVPIPDDPSAVAHVVLALLADAHAVAQAQDFMRFCLEPQAQAILRRHGYGCAAPAVLPARPTAKGGRP
jgi:molybdate transport system substrate-binding protein